MVFRQYSKSTLEILNSSHALSITSHYIEGYGREYGVILMCRHPTSGGGPQQVLGMTALALPLLAECSRSIPRPAFQDNIAATLGLRLLVPSTHKSVAMPMKILPKYGQTAASRPTALVFHVTRSLLMPPPPRRDRELHMPGRLHRQSLWRVERLHLRLAPIFFFRSACSTECSTTCRCRSILNRPPSRQTRERALDQGHETECFSNISSNLEWWSSSGSGDRGSGRQNS